MADDSADARGYKWETWSDFRAGIISQARFAYGANDNIAPVPFTGQPAAAQADGTFGCIALSNGGLAPMPGLVGTVLGPAAAFQDGVDNWITGALVSGPVFTGGVDGDELIYCIESIASNDRLLAICATLVAENLTILWNRVLKSFGPTLASNTLGQTFGFTAAMTMTNPSDPTGALTGTAGVALTTSFFDNASGSVKYLGIYPDPSNPGTTTTPHDYSGDLPTKGLGGIVIAHQNRIIYLLANSWLWTTGGGLVANFEEWYYTDPPNTVPGNGNADSLAQDVVFVQEWPVGVGAWGSMSAGELFLVKNRGGGYIVSGDLNFPTVTSLGGVTPSFTRAFLSASTPIGMVYGSETNGVWVWNGSNVSQKLSEQLNDDFFFSPTQPPNQTIQGAFQSWQDLLVTPNNYVYDTNNGGWWKLDDQTVPYSWYGVSFEGQSLYCFPGVVTDHTQPIAYKYSKVSPATAWQWTSYPLQVSKDKSIVVRELVVRAQGEGTITLTVTGVDLATGATTPTDQTFTTTAQPLTFRFDAGTNGLRAQDLTITIAAAGVSSGPAPIVYSLSIGWTDTKPLNQT